MLQTPIFFCHYPQVGTTKNRNRFIEGATGLRKLLSSFVICFGLLAGIQEAASATPIGVVNGATQLNITSFGTLSSLGVSLTPGGTANFFTIPALPSPILFYSVTSVDLDPASTRIFHVGSVLDLTTTNTVRLTDFIVDASAGFVLANVLSPSFNLQSAPIFAINKACSVTNPCIGLDGTVTVDGLELTLTAAAAGVLSQDLVIADLTGAIVAVANSSFTPIPEPGTGILALTGLLLLGLEARQRRVD